MAARSQALTRGRLRGVDQAREQEEGPRRSPPPIAGRTPVRPAGGDDMPGVVERHLQVVGGAENIGGILAKAGDALHLAGAAANLDSLGDRVVEPFGVISTGGRRRRAEVVVGTGRDPGDELLVLRHIQIRLNLPARSSLSSTAMSSTAASRPCSGSSRVSDWFVKVCMAQTYGLSRAPPCVALDLGGQPAGRAIVAAVDRSILGPLELPVAASDPSGSGSSSLIGFVLNDCDTRNVRACGPTGRRRSSPGRRLAAARSCGSAMRPPRTGAWLTSSRNTLASGVVVDCPSARATSRCSRFSSTSFRPAGLSHVGVDHPLEAGRDRLLLLQVVERFEELGSFVEEHHHRQVVAERCAEDLGVGAEEFLPLGRGFLRGRSRRARPSRTRASRGWRVEGRRSRPPRSGRPPWPPAATLRSCARCGRKGPGARRTGCWPTPPGGGRYCTR